MNLLDTVKVMHAGGPGSGRHSEDRVKHQVIFHNGQIGKGTSVVSEHDDLQEAKDKAKRMNKQLSPGEKKYYGNKFTVKTVYK